MRVLLAMTLLLVSALVAGGCDSDPPAQKDKGVRDASGETSGGGGDGPVADAGTVDADAALPDAKTDGQTDAPIDRIGDASVQSSHLVSAGTTSSGGKYTLHSQLGPGINPVSMAGGKYELRWNAALIPW